MEIIIAGFGGQGIMLAAYIAGKAATLYENKEAVFRKVTGLKREEVPVKQAS
jgi:hypothetical protein